MKRDRYFEFIRSEEYRSTRRKRAELALFVAEEEFANAGRIVEFGSGPGLFRAALEEKSGRPVFGAELDRRVIVDAGHTALCDAAVSPFADGTFDMVIINHVIEHVADPPAVLNEARRVLREQGVVYLTVMNRLWPWEVHYRLPFLGWMPRRLASLMLRLTGRGRDFNVRLPTWPGLKKLGREAGFATHLLTPRLLQLRDIRQPWAALLLLCRGLPPPLLRPFTTLLAPQWFVLLRHGEHRREPK